MDSRSSVDAAPVGAFVAWLLAAATSAQFALFLGTLLGTGVWLAWLAGLIVLGLGAKMAATPGEERRLVATQVALLVVPLIVLVLGLVGGSGEVAGFGGGLLGVLAVGWGLTVPITQWIAGLAPAGGDDRPPASPLPGASFAVALFFALPAPRIGSAAAGLVAVAALVMAASLGAIASRSRQGGVIATSPGLWTRWGGMAVALAMVAGLIGLGTAAATNPASLLGRPTDAPALPGPYGQEVDPQGTNQGGNSPQPSTPHDPLPPDQSSHQPNQGNEGNSESVPPPLPTSDNAPARDWRQYLALGAVALAALIALALARRYGDQIRRFLKRLVDRFGGPIKGWIEKWQARRELALLRTRAAGLPDPFRAPSDPPETAARIEATLAALDVVRRTNEPIAFHFLRAAQALGVDEGSWRTASRAANRARFAATPAPEEELQTLASLDDDLTRRLAALPDAEDRRQTVRLSYARTEPEPA